MTDTTVLVVDDSPELVRGVTTLLTNSGYRVVSLPNGSRVPETIALERPDLVVLDVMMPGVDGWEALRRIRENPANDGVRVMMLTAKGTEDAKVQGFTLGADDYLAKPFSIREFRCRVDALLRRTSSEAGAEPARIQVVADSGIDLIEAKDVFYAEGIRNYTYVHTYDARFLSRSTLGGIEDLCLPDFMRVHRSYIVRLGGVTGVRRASKSSFKLVLGDAEQTEIPVSRRLVADVKGRLGLD
jgi:DNA-binding LytR/AlgR family response regulator